MQTITLYRSMFKTIDGQSEFDEVLKKLGIFDEAKQHTDIELKVEIVKAWY